MRAYIGFGSTFNSFFKGLITTQDLKNGIILFGCQMQHLFHPCNYIPIEVALTVGKSSVPRAEGSYVMESDCPDVAVSAWREFQLIVDGLIDQNKAVWRVEDYDALMGQLVSDGFDVFYRGNSLCEKTRLDVIAQYNRRGYNGPYLAGYDEPNEELSILK